MELSLPLGAHTLKPFLMGYGAENDLENLALSSETLRAPLELSKFVISAFKEVTAPL